MKKIALFLMLCIVAISLCGCSCSSSYGETNNNEYFIFLEDCGEKDLEDTAHPAHLYIVYAKDTHVKYLIAEGFYRLSITPLYNADGTLQIYEGN